MSESSIRFDDLKDYLQTRFDALDDRVNGINERLDILNGKVYQHAQQISTLEGHASALDKTQRTAKRGMLYGGLSGFALFLAEVARHFYSKGTP